MSEMTDQLSKLLDDKNDKNYDPRMEELMRSDRLIDPTNEALSKLEEQEIFHISKIRGAQIGFSIPLWMIWRRYQLPHMQYYHSDYIDYIRSIDPKTEEGKKELATTVGGLAMTNEMIVQLIKLRHAEEAWTAKLYADSIKPAVANVNPMAMQPQEQQEGALSKIFSFFFGKKQEQNQGYQKR